MNNSSISQAIPMATWSTPIIASDSPERLRIQVSPLHVGPMMDEFLNQRMESIILTSATLTTQGSFEHITERLYTDDYRSVTLESPFDYRASTLVYLPEDHARTEPAP